MSCCWQLPYLKIYEAFKYSTMQLHIMIFFIPDTADMLIHRGPYKKKDKKYIKYTVYTMIEQ